ncbi:MAG: hypothetical protein HN737_02465 [Desulfobacterales bacterium]|jgi:hypothetical protein|nr:hypothetical protein [Desulfobacteraceae bacterium]MBT4365160.1 hypothetical protein [Desulfobacteraceae bacterium]MBT7086381.1 hypothetical protein [Desulfobacterales bacterium]MBT7696254.1 hypothetical protein [Desulfobacterales bacterium]
MHEHLKKILIFILGVLLISSTYIPSDAYVLSGSHLLDLMTKRLGTPRRLSVDQKIVLHNKHEGSTIELDETLKYSFPKRFRSDIFTNDTSKIHVLSSKESITIIGDIIISPSGNLLDHYKDILLFNSRNILKQRLEELGIDISISSIGRFQNRICYIIGARYPDESQPQLWLDKDSFKPIRWILKGSDDDNSQIEIHYTNWQKKKRTWYPMQIIFYEGEDIIRTVMAERIEINPSFSDSLFDIEYLKSVYQPLVPDTDTDTNDDVNEIKKAIEDFRNIFE